MRAALYLEGFERLLREWQRRGFELTDLGTFASGLDLARLPPGRILSGSVDGRSGTLAVQG